MKSRLPGGFALPTVMITSVIMLMVMLSAVTSTVAVRVSLDAQYYNQLSKTAGDAGVAYAKACLAANSGTPQWSDAKPLMPSTDCKGDQLVGFTCPANSVDPRCSIGVVDSNIIVSFSVPAPLPDTSGAFTNISANGSVTFLRSSDGGVWRQYKNTVKASKSPLSGIGNGIASSPEVTWKQSESGYWKQISTDGAQTCAIASNDQVYCWGYNEYGQLGNGTITNSSVPVAINTSGVLSGLSVKSISVGDLHSCAIASNDQAYCWGYNPYGGLGNNSTTQSNVPVAVTTTGALSGLTIKSISAGRYYTCAIASNNQAYCWGTNGQGQLGNSPSASSLVPVAVYTAGALNGLTIKSIDTMEFHTCAIASNDQAYCWGRNDSGQLGNDSVTSRSVPFAVNIAGALNGLTIKSIGVGNSHTCALASNNQVYCWGYGFYGQLGNNSTTQSNVPVAVDANGALNDLIVKSISVGGDYSCGIASNDHVYCWGYNIYGQLGNNSTTQSNTPVAVNKSGVLSGLSIKSISAGDNNSCVIASNNQAYCWGSNSAGVLGDGTNTNRTVPVAVVDGAFNSTATSTLSAGITHTCAIATNNMAYCWGYNGDGELGNGSNTDSLIPVAVDMSGSLNGLTFKSISAGSYYTCAIASNDQVYCWGGNSNGQLGNNSTTQSNIPVAINTAGVLSGLTIKSIAAGTDHTCVIASNNRSYCWGYNDMGQLGNSSTTQSSVPVSVYNTGVLNGLTIKSIALGRSHTCAIASNSQSYCWGYNNYGQLGDNTTNNNTVPIAVVNSGALNGLTVKSITAGGNHTCVIASNGLAYCWGSNGSGQLGDNLGSVGRLVPTAVDTSGVLSGLTVKSISGGNAHTCAIASNDQAYCWGDNPYGQLGNNSTTAINSPVAVNTAGAMSGVTVKSVDSGFYDTCILASNNKIYCWGYNISGQLGNRLTANSKIPVTVSTAGVLEVPTFNPISAGESNSCTIATDKKAYCWGNNANGQLGNNSTVDSDIPVPVYTAGVLSGLTIKAISTGFYHSCVIASDDKAYCWGYNYAGMLGNNSTTQSNVPTPVVMSGALSGLTIKSISVGQIHTCVVASNNQAYCWGSGDSGRLGHNSVNYSPVPVPVYTSGNLNGLTIKSISAGGNHTCAVASNNQAYCWGQNSGGQLGNSTINSSSVALPVYTSGALSGLTVKSINASGWYHTCAIASNDKAYCWGDNDYGQIGNNSTSDIYVPAAVYTSGVLNGLTIKSIGNGYYHTCAIASNNQVYCWGQNTYGALGNNSTTQSNVPIAVTNSGALSTLTVKSINSGDAWTCAVASNNQAYCWGRNTNGQLGNDSTTNSLVPVSVYTTGGPGWFSY